MNLIKHKAKAHKLWAKLEDIPTNEDEEIEIQFLHFEPGTHRQDIWHWFEDHFNLSVAEDLMGIDNTDIGEPS